MAAAFSMADLTAAVTSLVTAVVGWVETYLGAITGNPVLLAFCVALPLVGLGIGVIRRLVRIRA